MGDKIDIVQRMEILGRKPYLELLKQNVSAFAMEIKDLFCNAIKLGPVYTGDFSTSVQLPTFQAGVPHQCKHCIVLVYHVAVLHCRSIQISPIWTDL